MERTKYYYLTGVLLFVISSLVASNREIIYKAYISNNMEGWKGVLDKFEQTDNKSTEERMDLLNYQYGYIAWCIGNERFNEARKHLDEAFNNLSILEQTNANPSMLNAYKAAFYGYEIGLTKYKAPYYGLKSINASKKALEQNRDNWFAYVQSANIQYYMPGVFGGSKTEALLDYEKALVLMEKQKDMATLNWNYLNLLVVMAQGYTAIKNYNAAQLYFEKILKIEPEFSWVRNELYPQLLKMKLK